MNPFRPARLLVAGALALSLSGLGSLPANARTLEPVGHDRLLGHASLFENATAPTCDANTQTDQWMAEATANWTAEDIAFLDETGAMILPFMEAAMYGTPGDPRFELTLHAQELRQTYRKLQGFWNIKSDDIILIGADASIFGSVERMERVYREQLELPADEARETAQYVKDYLASSTTMKADNPVMTFNAFADSSYGEDPSRPDRIVMGEGLLRAYDELGYGKVGAEAALAHEFAHQMQIELGMVGPHMTGSLEALREVELHADAAAAYFATHPRGMSMQAKRATQLLLNTYDSGDCQVDVVGHHGTPAQREAAAEWAYQLQEQTRPKSTVLTAEEFTARFKQALPGILAAG